MNNHSTPHEASSIPASLEHLIAALIDPKILLEMTLGQWDEFIPLARKLSMLGRFLPRLEQSGQARGLPSEVLPHLQSASLLVEQHRRRILWELDRIQRVLQPAVGRVVLLKGAAYIAARLPCAEGRLCSDVDILSSKSDLACVEHTLLSNNWVSMVENEYDQRYYRDWAHELPPMRHMLRGTIIDVHHTILPVTGRLKPDPNRLLAAASPLPGNPGIAVLSAPDMVLHSAVHAFYDGDFSHFLRDILDLHELLSDFGKDRSFWPRLAARAAELQLERPLYYALRFTTRYLGTSIDRSIEWRSPNGVIAWLMDRLADRALAAPSGDSGAHWLLYARSHWLRMPPLMLIGHLANKSVRRFRPPPVS